MLCHRRLIVRGLSKLCRRHLAGFSPRPINDAQDDWLSWRPSAARSATSRPVQVRPYSSDSSRVPYLGTNFYKQLSAHEQRRLLEEMQRHALGEPSSEAARLTRDILEGRVDAAQFLQTETLNGTATLEKIRVCLSADLERLKKIPRRSRLQNLHQRKHGLGLNVLNLLWKDESLWVPLIVHDRDARAALCFFAVAEGLQDSIGQWLKVAFDDHKLEEGSRAWRGRLLHAIIAALLIHDIEHSATKALRCFFDAVSEKDELKHAYRHMLGTSSAEREVPAFAFTKLIPATRYLVKELGFGRYPNTDAVMYSNLVKFFEQTPQMDTLLIRDYNLAALDLHHPAQPDPEKCLCFLQTYFAHVQSPADLETFLHELPFKNQAKVLRLLIERTADVLKKQGRAVDAAWVTQQATKLPPEVRNSQGMKRRDRSRPR